MLSIHEEINGIRVDLDFEDGIYNLVGDSVSGKSFLLKVFAKYCEEHCIPYFYFDNNTKNIGREGLLQICEGKEIILLNNATLYLEKGIVSEMIALGSKTVIAEYKDELNVFDNKETEVIVNYTGDTLSIERW